MLTLKGKNIIIMGGTSGLGLESAKAFIDNGANVVIVGLDEEKCKLAQSELGSSAIVVQGNATEPETIDRAIDAFSGNTIHGLFHVAGGSGRKYGDGPLHELTLDGWNETLKLNLTSIMLSNKAMIKYFLKNGVAGSILNMGSVLGYSPAPQYFSTHAYAAAKAAIIGFSKSIAAYYAKDNICINVVAPALFVTPMSARASNDENILRYIKTKQPLDHGRPGYPKDIVGAACFFMSDSSSFVTGQVLGVDGGWSISEGQY